MRTRFQTTRPVAALSGLLAAAAALGVTELFSGAVDSTRSLVFGVGDYVIDQVPGWLERRAIATLGTADKPVLVGGILVFSALFGAGLGLLATRRFPWAAAGFVAFGLIGATAAAADPRSDALAAYAGGLLGAAAGIGALRLLLAAATAPAGVVEPDGGDAPPVLATPGRDIADRRRFLGVAAGVTAAAAIATMLGRALVDRGRIGRIREAIRIPRPARPAEPVPDGADL